MNEVESITVKGFKSIHTLEELKLRGINVVIGPNGSGKSNFIGIFSFLNAIREGRLQEYVIRAGGAEKILHFGSKTTTKLTIKISFKDDINQYEINLQPGTNDQLIPVSEYVRFWNKNYPAPYTEPLLPNRNEAGISAPPTQNAKTYKFVRSHLNQWKVYHFHDTSPSSPMKKTCDINDNAVLRPDGANLAAFLYFLKEKHEISYSLICKTIQSVAPFFYDFQLSPQKLNPDKIILEWKHKGSDGYFDASALSDGTLRFIALTTLFLQPDIFKPSVILVDEPELGLHPYAITMLASLVKSAATSTQVILSTQSPLLIDNFEPEDIMVANRTNGGTQFSRLDSDKLAAWLESYSLGQLWEKNELGGRPHLEQ